MDEQHFRRMTVFSGDDCALRDWSFQLRAAIRGAEKGVLDVTSWVELAPSEVMTEDIETQFVEESGVEQWGVELYDVLCSLTSGEALKIVRGQACANGFMAWKNLYKRFTITRANALAVMMEVMNPPKLSDQNRVPKARDDWDIKVATL